MSTTITTRELINMYEPTTTSECTYSVYILPRTPYVPSVCLDLDQDKQPIKALSEREFYALNQAPIIKYQVRERKNLFRENSYVIVFSVIIEKL